MASLSAIELLEFPLSAMNLGIIISVPNLLGFHLLLTQYG